MIAAVVRAGYTGDFAVEDEGSGDGTLRLQESVRRARIVAASLTNRQ
jgi:hypothetical protein